jgi:hypothetical protein
VSSFAGHGVEKIIKKKIMPDPYSHCLLSVAMAKAKVHAARSHNTTQGPPIEAWQVHAGRSHNTTQGPQLELIQEIKTNEDIEKEAKKEAKEAKEANQRVRDELEKLQIKTIFSLVEPLEVEFDYKPWKKKLLFISNKQAREIDLTNIWQVLEAMEVTPVPQLVINLLPSCQGHFHPLICAGAFWGGNKACREKMLKYNLHGEKSTGDVDATDLNVLMFLQQCVMPVAIQHNALVLMHSDQCELAKAFSQLCVNQMEKMGKLPFTTMCIVAGIDHVTASNNKKTMAYALKKKSKRWQAHETKMQNAVSDYYGKAQIGWESSDLPAGCTHYVVVDGVSGTGVDWTPRSTLKNKLMQQLADALPNLGIATMSYNRTRALTQYEDYVGRQLPLLLLDARPRPKKPTPSTKADKYPNADKYPSDLAAVGTELDELQRDLENAGTLNFHLVSMVAYMHQVLALSHKKNLLAQKEDRRSSKMRLSMVDVNGDGLIDSSELAAAAKEMKERKEELLHATEWIWRLMDDQGTETKTTRNEDASNDHTATEEETMEIARLMEKKYCEGYAFRWTLEATKYKQYSESIMNAEDTKKALGDVIEKFSTQMVELGDEPKHFEKLLEKFSNALYKRQKDQKGNITDIVKSGSETDALHWAEVLVLKEEIDFSGDRDISVLKKRLSETFLSWAEEYNKKGEADKKKRFGSNILMGAFNLLRSPNLHSGNITDRKLLSDVVMQVAKVDRLPSRNSREAMKIVRSAWDHVDIYVSTARWCKMEAKVLYALMLLTGLGTTIVATLALMSRDPSYEEYCSATPSCVATPGTLNGILLSPEEAQYYILGLSIAGSLVASTISYLNPTQRWQKLRGAALSLESEIWKFRCRVGLYTMAKRGFIGRVSRESERKLMDFQREVARQVTKTMLDTTLLSRFTFVGPIGSNLRTYRHGQYEGAGIRGTFGASNREKTGDVDNHQSPLHPLEYINFRIKPTLDFYQRRLPRYYLTRTVLQILLLIATFTSTILAFFGWAGWAAIPTAVATAATAWQEFAGTNQKLNRYSGTIEQLGALTDWWMQLSDVEQASMLNLHKLILSCEAVMEKEREAWLSLSIDVAMLSEGGGQDGANGEGRISKAPAGSRPNGGGA